MPKFTRQKTLHIMTAAALCMSLTACLEAGTDSNASVSRPAPKSFTVVKHNVPLCYAAVTKNMDSVVTLKKDKKGHVIGKTFGVKKAPNKAALQPFEQKFEGRLADNGTIKVDVRTEFEEARINRSDTITLKKEAILFGKINMKAGHCKKLVNNFLDRNIDRRRMAEKAAIDVF